ncbi:MAG: hypothetical protein Q8940_07145, partial [Bacteroidota bacterium]|nr:hypothetical protein [Bacteroidota bacterium]
MPFAIDDLLIGAGVSAGTGLLSSLFSGDSERTQALKKLRDKINSIQALTRGQIQDDLSSIDRSAKTVVTGTLNQTALSTAGRQNATASILASLAPSLAQARTQRDQQLNDYNRNLPFQKAQMEAGIDSQLDSDTPQQNVMNILGLGLQGALTSTIGRGTAKEEIPQNPWGPQNINTVSTTGMDLTPIPAPDFGSVSQLTLPPVDV